MNVKSMSEAGLPQVRCWLLSTQPRRQRSQGVLHSCRRSSRKPDPSRLSDKRSATRREGKQDCAHTPSRRRQEWRQALRPSRDTCRDSAQQSVEGLARRSGRVTGIVDGRCRTHLIGRFCSLPNLQRTRSTNSPSETCGEIFCNSAARKYEWICADEQETRAHHGPRLASEA